MIKTKSKYTWEGWNSSGNEDWVFSVKHPCELIGVHAKLIDKELKESEKIEYCVYSPRVSSTSTPFGLKSEEASRGICVTDKRFIISEDRHVEGMEPKLTSINFKDIRYFNIGNALLLGWFSIHYRDADNSKDMIILFGSTGRHHFEKLIRSYKKYSPESRIDVYDIESYHPSSFIYNIKDNMHRDDLKKLVSSGERCVSTFLCKYLLGVIPKKRWFWGKREDIYLTNNATVLQTNKSLLIARSGRDDSAGVAIDIMDIPLGKIESAAVSRDRMNNAMIYQLKISFSDKQEPERLDIPLLDKDTNIGTFLLALTMSLNKYAEGMR